MDYEETLKKAYDLIADFEDAEAYELLETCIADIKKTLSGTQKDADRYYYWGLCLSAMDEPEQALLKFELAIGLDPQHESALWEVVSTLLYELDKPDSAKVILEERLLKAFPENEKYQEALRLADLALREQGMPREIRPLTEEDLEDSET